MQRARGGDRLGLAAERGGGGDVAGEQPSRAQLAHGARMPAGQRAALGLDVAEPARGCAPGERPGDRRELAVQREHRDGLLDGQLQLLLLDRHDGVLQARVVELHHVRGAVSLAGEPAREVGVHPVEAARAEPQVERLHVDDHLIADLAAPHQRHVCHRWAPRGARHPGERDDELLLGRRVGVREATAAGADDLEDGGAAKLEHGAGSYRVGAGGTVAAYSSRASATSSMSSSAATLTRSPGS